MPPANRGLRVQGMIVVDAFEVDTARRLARLASYKDCEGSGHVDRVGRLSALLAEAMGMAPDTVELIRHAAPLHDIGNVAIPESILLKDGALSLEELDLIKTHIKIGGDLLSGSSSRVMQLAEQIARSHHENWDGTGYLGVAEDQIPIAGRIVRVADTYDSTMQARPFRVPWQRNEAVEFITSEAGRRFDPDVVRAFVRVVEAGGLNGVEEDA